MMKMKASTIRITGISWNRNLDEGHFCGRDVDTVLLEPLHDFACVASTYATRYVEPSESSPWITPSPSRNSAVSTFPASTSAWNSPIVIGSDAAPRLLNSTNNQIAARTITT